MIGRAFLAALVCMLPCWVTGCGVSRTAARPAGDRVTSFHDMSQAAGIAFRHHAGMRGKKYMPETVGSGCAFLDFDGDGWMDLLFVNSTDWPGPGARAHYPALYRNNRDGTFADVTAQAGLRLDLYGMGAAVGDYDNDGYPDVYLTCIGPNHLFHNNGDGTFTDVTSAAGVAGAPVEPGGIRWKWSASAAWVDYDRDGNLDLFVTNYVKWTPDTDPWCGVRGIKAYCPPTNFEGVPSLLYRNRGSGQFEDVSEESGIAGTIGKSFGVAVADYDRNGWPDLAVSNDLQDNFLFVNGEGKRFEERGLEAGMALAPTGIPRAGMGIDAADWRNDGTFGLIVGNFSREGLALFQHDGKDRFTEVTYPANLGESSILSLTFGLFFFDYDLDGRQDIFAANGHIDDFVHRTDALVTYEQLPLLYRGRPNGTFENAGPRSGPALAAKRVLRGAAHGDLDNDGDPEIAVVWNNRRGEIWRNDGDVQGRWIGLQLRGSRSNRDGIGALVRLTSSGVTQTAYRHSGGSFLSEHDPRIRFGLGRSERAESIDIRWPSGTASRFDNVSGGRYYVAEEDQRQLRPLQAGSPSLEPHGESREKL